jgi:hypothetical protein
MARFAALMFLDHGSLCLGDTVSEGITPADLVPPGGRLVGAPTDIPAR